MPGKSDYFENALLQMVFGTTVVTKLEGVFANPGAPNANLYVSLHTVDPGDTAANQTVNECTYSGYARVAVSRTTGFVVTGNSVSPAANIDFPPNGAGATQIATYFAIGTAAAGTSGKILYTGTITPNITISAGVIPRLTTLTAITED